MFLIQIIPGRIPAFPNLYRNMTNQILRGALLCFILTVFSSAFSQETKPSTLGQLWTHVEEHYVGIHAKDASIAAAQLNERVVKSGMLPQLNAQAQNTYSSYEGMAGAFFPQSGLFNVSGPANTVGSNATANSFASATVDWELFSFGILRKKNEAAKALTHKKTSEKEGYLLQLKKTLSERYIQLLFTSAKLDLAQKNVERLDSIRWITSGLSAAGLRPAADSLLASSSFIQSTASKNKWQGFKNASAIKLRELYGATVTDYSHSVQRFTGTSLYTLNAASAISASHPKLEALTNEESYLRFSSEAQNRSALPSLHLIGGYAFRGTGIDSDATVSGQWRDGFSNNSTNYIAGIGITWNLSNLHTNQLKGKELSKEADRVKLVQTQYQQNMQADLEASRANLEQQILQLTQTKLAVQQAERAYAMYVARFKSGLITLSELLQLRLLLENAENSHIEASRDYWLQLANEAALTADFDFLFTYL